MKTIAQLHSEKQKIEEQIKKLQDEELSKDFIEADKGRIRIYKWSRQVKDFPMPKGFELIEERDFIDLYDNDLIKLQKYPVIYFTKNKSKKNVKVGWSLSRLCLYSDLDLYSNVSYLADSNDYGRVVIVRIGGKGE